MERRCRIPLARGLGRSCGRAALVAALMAVFAVAPVSAGHDWAGSVDLTAGAGAPRSFAPRPYSRADGKSAVVSQGDGYRIYELSVWHPLDEWEHVDLLAAAGGAPLGFAPQPYIRADWVSAVVYQGIYDRHLHELARIGGQWTHTDLTVAAGGAPLPSAGTVARGHVRDEISTVVYPDDAGRIHELARIGDGWVHSDLTAQAGGAPLAAHGTDIAPYTRADGVPAVVYASASGVHELRPKRVIKGWYHTDLTAAAGAPAAKLRLDAHADRFGYSSVYYLGDNGHIHNLYQHESGGAWNHSDATAFAGAPTAAADSEVSVFSHFDRTVMVTYRDGGGRIQQLQYRAASGWGHKSLSTLQGALAARSVRGLQWFNGMSVIVYSTPGDGHIRQLWHSCACG